MTRAQHLNWGPARLGRLLKDPVVHPSVAGDAIQRNRIVLDVQRPMPTTSVQFPAAPVVAMLRRLLFGKLSNRIRSRLKDNTGSLISVLAAHMSDSVHLSSPFAVA